MNSMSNQNNDANDTPIAHAIADRLKRRKEQNRQPILLMAHLVLGFPSFEENSRTITAMADAGVDLIELQMPFSEPIADGPVIARANQQALDNGFRVDAGFDFIQQITARHPAVTFLIMTYGNIVLARGEERFIQAAAERGIKGFIVPDIPLEQAGSMMDACRANGIDWTQLMTAASPPERLKTLGAAARGFVYCVARKGVTGKQTSFDDPVNSFISACRQATPTALAVGFGVKDPEDVAFLTGKAEIAVVGTAALKVHEEGGAEAVGRYFEGLRG